MGCIDPQNELRQFHKLNQLFSLFQYFIDQKLLKLPPINLFEVGFFEILGY